jgi:hypothetical protein
MSEANTGPRVFDSQAGSVKSGGCVSYVGNFNFSGNLSR